MEQQDKKYYIPDISELYIGYECLLKNRMGGGWEETKLSGYDIQELYMIIPEAFNTDIMTPYLTREDIESLGWKLTKQIGQSTIYRIEEWSLIVDNEKVYEYIEIGREDEYMHGYNGECRSVNQLRTLMSWLNIPINDNNKTEDNN